MIHSMTGYAAGQGAGEGYRWSWELRSVNGRGLDIRIKVPDWIDGLEGSIRKHLGGVVARGNVTVSLRLHRDEISGGATLNTAQLDQILAAMRQVEAAALNAGLDLKPSTAAEIVSMRGVMDQFSENDGSAALKALLEAEFPPLVASFAEMRSKEGDALRHILAQQLDTVATLTDECADLLQRRQDDMATTLRRNLARIMEGVSEIDEARVAQELALIAVKSDVTEEIDRLRAHVKAARSLLEDGGAVGRKLDFLMQEFNREANTLCSKAQMKELTEKGLALKVVIDQMREQVQNVE